MEDVSPLFPLMKRQKVLRSSSSFVCYFNCCVSLGALVTFYPVGNYTFYIREGCCVRGCVTFFK